MKICVFAAIDVSISDAAVIHFSGIAEGLLRESNEVFALLPTSEKPPVMCIQKMRAPITWLYSAKKMGLPNAVSSLMNLPSLLYFVRSKKIEVVYLRTNLLSVFLVVPLRLFTNAFVITEHNGWFADESRFLKHPKIVIFFEHFFQKWEAKWSHFIRVVTPGLARLFEEKGIQKEKIVVLGNGTDVEKNQAIAREEALKKLNLAPDNFYLGFIGNLAAWQGLMVAVEAMPILLATFPKIRLIIAGSGVERHTLEEQAKYLGVFEHIIFLGAIPYENVNQVVSAFDIAIAPFTRERNEKIGLSPLKIRDYAALGRKVIAADIAGIKELSGFGWLDTFQADNSADFAKVVMTNMQNQENAEQVSLKARQYAEDYFSWQMIARHLNSEILSRIKDE